MVASPAQHGVREGLGSGRATYHQNSAIHNTVTTMGDLLSRLGGLERPCDPINYTLWDGMYADAVRGTLFSIRVELDFNSGVLIVIHG